AARPPGGDERRESVRSSPDAGEWQLLLVHAGGSLERVIAMSRRRNLAIGFGVVLLVAASVVSITISTRRAQRLARQQVEFVAGVSHELRTPLSVIRSAGENLSDGVIAEPAQVRRYGAMIADEGRRLSEMVEQVMSFAGFGSGRDLSDRTETEAGAVIEAALAATRSLIERSGFTVEQRVAPDLPRVRMNGAAVAQAIGNLISNAVKYGGSERWVRVTAGRAVTPGGAGVRITVEDHGIGIPPDEQRRIFEPFYRGHGVLGSTIRGSGLGLSLVRRIVEAHGGSISVESAPGKGSAFTVYLSGRAGGESV
ncbi:MAG: HAMP domain-containing histidine kinase, partial [Planctomycetes bacterium]|nr:HAMP domain-containing histidine kinase [Planctomycetota bacterium]